MVYESFQSPDDLRATERKIVSELLARGLSEKQRRIVEELLARGLSEREIGEKLLRLIIAVGDFMKERRAKAFELRKESENDICIWNDHRRDC